MRRPLHLPLSGPPWGPLWVRRGHPPQPRARRPLPGLRRRLALPAARLVLLSLVLAGAAALLTPASPRPEALDGLRLAPWWLFAGLFAVTEACVVQLRLRREAFSLSLSEAPLVIGLFLARPSELLVGRVLGSALVFVAHRRQRPMKAGFNTALVAAGTAVAVTLFRSMLPADAGPFGPVAVSAALAATVGAGILDSLALTLVVGWYASPVTARVLLGEVASSVAVSTLVGAAGLLAVAALRGGEATLPLALAGAIALLAYRGFATLADRHTSLERLYELSDSLAATPGWNDVLGSVLRRSSDLLRAGYVEVLLAGHGPGRAPLGPQRWWLRAGAPGFEPEVEGPQDAAELVGVGLPFPPVRPALLRPADEEARSFLEARGLHEALVVPLRLDEVAVGQLVVGDRTGEARFVHADVRLLETVANHGSVALRNGRLIDRLHHEAREDELTGLPNRLRFRELLDSAAEAAAAGGPVCAVMVLDFDGFKAINDTLGHQAGDDLLRVLAGRLDAEAAGHAMVARLGGDEFAILSTRCANESEAMRLARHLLTTFDEPVSVGGARLRLSGSVGVALGPRHGADGSDLLRSADIAMYAAKAAVGGARLFSPDMDGATTQALVLASDLRDAIAADEVDVAVQPLVDLGTGAVHSVEVLARWHHAVLGDVSPAALFEAAGRTSQVATLSVRILDRALGLARSWQDRGLPVRVAVNLAPRWLADSTLPQQVASALERHGVPADLLCLEIRESSVLADPRRGLAALGELRGMGVHLAVDDFGTGYSSLTYLSRLPVDQLKIDRSFVGRLRESSRDRAIARSIIELGDSLGLEVVGEGVTDEPTREALVGLGCRLGQGYLFAEPRPAAQIEALLDLRSPLAARVAVAVPAPSPPPAPPLVPPPAPQPAPQPAPPPLPRRPG
jgi:diguanylate cyclase (GGDEF)-like protein